MAEPIARSVMLVLHDVAPPTWPAYEAFVREVDNFGDVPITWLVVPDFHKRYPLEADHKLRRVLDRRVERGDELALHGYFHCDDGHAPRTAREYFMRRIYTWEGEFYTLDEAQALARLTRGIELFARSGWPLHGFVAPAWLMSDGTREALRGLPLAYTSDVSHFYRLPDFLPIAAPGIVWSARSAWRRSLSKIYSQLREHQLRTSPIIRLGLHPVDMAHPLSRDYWLTAIRRLLEEGRHPVTKIAWLQAQVSFSDAGVARASSAGCNSCQSCAAPSKSVPSAGVSSSGS
jgi:predicted deacetylase